MSYLLPTKQVALGVILVLLGFALFSIDKNWVIDPDSAAYVGLARSLSAGEGYSFSDVPHTKYPPFFPVVLALAGALSSEESYGAMQYWIASFWIVSIGVVFLLFAGIKLHGSSFVTRGIPKNGLTGLVFALLMASSIYMLQYATVFLRTEMVFCALSLASVWLALRIQQDEGPSFPRLCCFVALFVCTYLTRMAGVALVGAMILVFVLDKGSWVRRSSKWLPAMGLIVLCMAGPALWMVRNKAIESPASTDYASEFTQSYGLDLTKNQDFDMETISVMGMCRRILENMNVFTESCAKMLLNSNRGGAKSAVKFAVGILCVFGLFFCLVRRRSFVDYYCLLYLLLYFVWPFNQQQRFYMPIFPFLVEYAAITILFLNRLLPLVLRHKGVWFIFFALQVPLLAAAFAARSNNAQVLGRYSYTYTVFLAAVTLSILAVDVFLIVERKRPGGLKWMMHALRQGVPLLYVCGFVSLGFHDLLVVYPSNHEKFVRQREEVSVPTELERIEAHPELIRLSTWIMEHTEEDEVIMCDIPKMIHIMTGRRTVPFTFYSKREAIAEEVWGLKPSYVYYSGEIDWVYRFFKKACREYEKVFSKVVDVGGGEKIEPALYRLP
jgi:hypothetical protein